MAATFAPIAYSLALANGSMDPQSILTCLTLTCTLGIATPAATAASAVLHGDTEWVRARMIFRYALPYWVFNIVMGTLITYNSAALCSEPAIRLCDISLSYTRTTVPGSGAHPARPLPARGTHLLPEKNSGKLKLGRNFPHKRHIRYALFFFAGREPRPPQHTFFQKFFRACQM